MQLALPLIPVSLPLDAAMTPASSVSVGPSSPYVTAPVPPVLPVPLEIEFVRRHGARRYILRVTDDGRLRVTVPWWGSRREARQFAESQEAWVARQRASRAARPALQWRAGVAVLVDGVPHQVTDLGEGRVAIGAHVVEGRAEAGETGGAVRAWLRARAVVHLPGELTVLAERHGIEVTRMAIRDQRSRWGSCSRRGTISLNWRLVQTPPFVREYVLLHELMHRRELNHSARFWRLVTAACPRHVEARRWLRGEGALLF